MDLHLTDGACGSELVTGLQNAIKRDSLGGSDHDGH
jgi:hypothetical protein